MNGTSLLMHLRWRCLGNETKTNALCGPAPCPHPFGRQFFWQCGRTPKKSRALFIAVDHLPVSLLEIHFMEEEWNLLCASWQGREGLFHRWYSSGLCTRWNRSTLYQETPWLLRGKCNNICFCESKSWIPLDVVLANLICKGHSLLWIRNTECSTQSLECCYRLLNCEAVTDNQFSLCCFFPMILHVTFLPFVFRVSMDHICHFTFVCVLSYPTPQSLRHSLTHTDHVKWKRQRCFMSLYPRSAFFSIGRRHLISLRLKIDSFRP